MHRSEEHQHNSREQAREYLAGALALVAELDPPEDLRTACFVKAADLLASKQVFFEQVQPMGVRMAIPRG